MECPLVSPAALQSPWIDPVHPPHRISPSRAPPPGRRCRRGARGASGPPAAPGSEAARARQPNGDQGHVTGGRVQDPASAPWPGLAAWRPPMVPGARGMGEVVSGAGRGRHARRRPCTLPGPGRLGAHRRPRAAPQRKGRRSSSGAGPAARLRRRAQPSDSPQQPQQPAQQQQQGAAASTEDRCRRAGGRREVRLEAAGPAVLGGAELAFAAGLPAPPRPL